MTVSTHLQAYIFQDIHVRSGKFNLTFKKGCRLVDVRLDTSDILTNGQLWKLGLRIDTATFPGITSRTKDQSNLLAPHQQDRLTQLADILRSTSHKDIADATEAYLHQCRAGHGRPGGIISRDFLRLMAQEVVRAIDKNRILRLARLCGPQTTAQYMAIFICDKNDVEGASSPSSGPGGLGRNRFVDFAFTAFDRRLRATTGTDHHVSLQVDCQNLLGPKKKRRRSQIA
jgi:hypothetical protein